MSAVVEAPEIPADMAEKIRDPEYGYAYLVGVIEAALGESSVGIYGADEVIRRARAYLACREAPDPAA